MTEPCTSSPEGEKRQRPVLKAWPVERLSRLFWTAAIGCIGALPVTYAPAAASSVASPSLDYRQPDAVPGSWVRYAQLVQYRFKEWLAADNEVAYRFHLFLENRTANADAPPDQLIVKAWIAGNGKVQKVEFASLHDKQADKDLHTILSRGNIGEPPPIDMLQPLHLRLLLQMPN